MPEQPLPFPSLIVGSLNDPYMSFDRLRHVSTRWGSRLVDLGHAGHINVASGFGRWQRGYDLLTVLNGIARREQPSVNAVQAGEKREVSAAAGR